MSELDDILGAKQPKKPSDLVELDIEALCNQCGESAIEVLYDKAKKRLHTKCSREHEIESEVDLSWLVN